MKTLSMVPHNRGRGHFLEETAYIHPYPSQMRHTCVWSITPVCRVPYNFHPHYHLQRNVVDCTGGLLLTKLLRVLVFHIKEKQYRSTPFIAVARCPLSESDSSMLQPAYFLQQAYWAEIAHAENLKSGSFGIVARVYVFAKVTEIQSMTLQFRDLTPSAR